MKNPNANKIIPINLREKAVKELYKAGASIIDISKNLDISTKEIKTILGDVPIYPNKKPDNTLINQILYDENVPLTTEVIIENEKARFAEYTEIERKSLCVMNTLLNFYIQHSPTGNITEDKEIAQMVTSFIKATQNVRQELLKKYEIDKRVSEDDKKMKIEFI